MFDENEYDKIKLKSLIKELIKLFPNIDSDVIKNRVSFGFRFGEGEKPILKLEDWIDIFNEKKTTSLYHIEDAYYITFINPGLIIIYNFKTGREFSFEYNKL